MADFTIGDYRYRTVAGEPGHVRATVVDNSKRSYEDIPETVENEGVEYRVTSLSSCFDGCYNMTAPPSLPDSVTNMRLAFGNCTKLSTAPAIPSGVTNMTLCFDRCSALTRPPAIPDSVTSLAECFYGCGQLAEAPVIPNGVTNVGGCFYGCINLWTAPVIPDSVTTIDSCFNGCTSLTTVPIIPASVDSVKACFINCYSLRSVTVANALSSSTNAHQFMFAGCYNVAIYLSPDAEEGAAETWRGIAAAFDGVYFTPDNPAPSLSFSAVRSSASGEPSDQGEYAALKAVVTLYETDAPLGSNSVESTSLTVDGSERALQWTVTVTQPRRWEMTAVVSFADLDRHSLSLLVEDAYGKSSPAISAVLSSALPAIDFMHDSDSGLHGVSVGKLATRAGLLDVGMQASFDRAIQVADALSLPVYRYASVPAESDLPSKPCVVVCEDGEAWMAY